jgi:hypothetical protein
MDNQIAEVMRARFSPFVLPALVLIAGCDPAEHGQAAQVSGDAEELVGSFDFGAAVEDLLVENTPRLFGVVAPLARSAPATTGPYRGPDQAAAAQVALAEGLSARYLTRSAANSADMFAFWPSDTSPTHVIFCIEGAREDLGAALPDGSAKLNPSVQSIDLATGQVSTILRGMDRCDGIRRTPWGTILATEETGDGGAYEIIQPLAVADATVLDRGGAGQAAAITDQRAVKRIALPTMAWEGLEVRPSGVVIGGDELRPGTGVADSDGGAIFKFVPDQPRMGSGRISDLAQSPLAAGRVHALQVSCVDNRQQVGQGCEVGNAAWVEVEAASARSDADRVGATGYYRPEDLHGDPVRVAGAPADAVRFCWTNTGNEAAALYAEVMCGVDEAPLVADPAQRTVEVSRFLQGDRDFNSFDNLAFQPRTGNLYVVEDHDNGDIFACLRDRGDRDLETDGCIRVLSVRDSSAEPTGFAFSGDGTVAILSIQHSDDTNMPLVDDYPTDDIVMITGFVAF